MTSEIRIADLEAPETLALLDLHLRGMHAFSPPGSVHALDVSALRRPGVTVWGLYRDGRLAGIGALRLLDCSQGEVKSMRTHPDFLRSGVGAALLEHIIGEARSRGLRRLSLETGTGNAFDPALALYRRRGFEPGAAFGGYAESDFNRFLHLDLPAEP